MRELKFRAWVGSENTDFIDMPSHYEYDVTLVNGKYADVESGWDIHGVYENVPIEQYTGLKDKNGKEIYEGDIVDYNDDDGYIGVVKYDAPEFYLDAGATIFRAFLKGAPHQRVIGNIHENPELLEAKNVD